MSRLALSEAGVAVTVTLPVEGATYRNPSKSSCDEMTPADEPSTVAVDGHVRVVVGSIGDVVLHDDGEVVLRLVGAGVLALAELDDRLAKPAPMIGAHGR